MIDRKEIHRRWMAGDHIWTIAQDNNLTRGALQSLIIRWRKEDGSDIWPYEAARHQKTIKNRVTEINVQQPKKTQDGRRIIAQVGDTWFTLSRTHFGLNTYLYRVSINSSTMEFDTYQEAIEAFCDAFKTAMSAVKL